MDKKTAGYIVFLAAIGMLLSLIGLEVSNLMHWNEALAPSFIGTMMLHIATVITAFVGGKLVPEDRAGLNTRSTDK